MRMGLAVDSFKDQFLFFRELALCLCKELHTFLTW